MRWSSFVQPSPFLLRSGDIMGTIIGIRREDKNKWERRVPLVPSDLANLKKKHDIEFIIQPSPIRVFTDEDYISAGLTVEENISEAEKPSQVLDALLLWQERNMMNYHLVECFLFLRARD